MVQLSELIGLAHLEVKLSVNCLLFNDKTSLNVVEQAVMNLLRRISLVVREISAPHDHSTYFIFLEIFSRSRYGIGR